MKKIVIKTGGALNVKHGVPNLPLIESFAKDLYETNQELDFFVVLVVSGAIPIGFRLLRDWEMDTSSEGQSLYSMAGQTSLFSAYENCFRNYGFSVCSGTYTTKTLKNKHTIKVLEKAKKNGNILLVNEADNVNPEEIFGDNDYLASNIAKLIKADLLILLSAIKNGVEYPEKLSAGFEGNTISKIPLKMLDNNDFIASLDNGKKSRESAKGMTNKLLAGKMAGENGIPVIIANGNEENILKKILLQGKKKGTMIVP